MKWLQSSINKLKRNEEAAFVKRVMWLGFDKRIHEQFDIFMPLLENSKEHLGEFSITSTFDFYKFQAPLLTKIDTINSIHISTGTRYFKIWSRLNKENDVEELYERNSQLWYSQSPAGDVMVFISPYTSNAHTIKEENIIIKRYDNPAQITNSEILNNFKIFIKYCVAVNIYGGMGLKNYLFRQYLIAKDFRSHTLIRSKLVKVTEKLIFIIIGVTGILVTYYASK